jgi:hypothetical protein
MYQLQLNPIVQKHVTFSIGSYNKMFHSAVLNDL